MTVRYDMPPRSPRAGDDLALRERVADELGLQGHFAGPPEVVPGPLDTGKQSDILATEHGDTKDSIRWDGQLWFLTRSNSEQNKKRRKEHAAFVRSLTAIVKELEGECDHYGHEVGCHACKEIRRWGKRLAEVERCPGYTRRHKPCAGLVYHPHSCHEELCPWCQSRRQTRLLADYAVKASSMLYPVVLTLTLRNVQKINREYMRAVKKAFARLRKRKVFTGVLGGIWAVETVHGWRGWHVHAHALMDAPGAYIPVWPCWDIEREGDKWAVTAKHKGLSAEWQSVTAKFPELEGGGFVVDIRRADAGTLAEVVKYVVKGSDITGSPKLVREYLEATRGLRGAGTWGTMRDVGKEIDEAMNESRTLDTRERTSDYVCPWCHGEGDWEFVQYGWPEDSKVYRNPETRSQLVLCRSGP